MASSRLGLSESQTRSATGGLLQGLKQNVNEKDFNELQQKMPESQEVMQEAPQQEGGLMGGLTSQVSKLGGNLGGISGIVGPMLSSGVNQDQAGGLVSMFLDYLRQKAGSGLLGRILSQVPGLKSFAQTPTR
jgi:hypothetical protein